ncbi:MAG TPA: oligoendopeptidase F, partial [Limnochordia bacterium]|nr:oligoendopeptidase F [Limnochordia bacterium]
MKKRLTRQEVPKDLTWNLTDIFPSDETWETALQEVLEALSTVTSYQERLNEGATVFFDCLEALEALSKEFTKVAGYAYLKQATDGTDPANQAMLGRSSAAGAQFAAQTAFVRSEALALPDGTLERYLKEEPRLK